VVRGAAAVLTTGIAGAPIGASSVVIVSAVDLEEHSLDPVIERTCAECGARLTAREIQASLESGGPYLCSVHAAEEVPVEEEQEQAEP
jgi:hypothetical protein